jgi:hypothetical protein
MSGHDPTTYLGRSLVHVVRHDRLMAVAPEEIDLANQLLREIGGRPLIAFRMGGGVHLEFGEPPYYEITIEGRLRVAHAGGPERQGDPVSPEVAQDLIPLLNAYVTTAAFSPDGTLTIVFDDVRVVVPPGDRYEAWQMRSDDDLLIVGTPGGGVAIWGPTNTARDLRLSSGGDGAPA